MPVCESSIARWLPDTTFLNRVHSHRTCWNRVFVLKQLAYYAKIRPTSDQDDPIFFRWLVFCVRPRIEMWCKCHVDRAPWTPHANLPQHYRQTHILRSHIFAVPLPLSSIFWKRSYSFLSRKSEIWTDKMFCIGPMYGFGHVKVFFNIIEDT